MFNGKFELRNSYKSLSVDVGTVTDNYLSTVHTEMLKVSSKLHPSQFKDV